MVLLPGTRVTGQQVDVSGTPKPVDKTLDASLFLVDRSVIDECNTCKKNTAISQDPNFQPVPCDDVQSGVWEHWWPELVAGTVVLTLGLFATGVYVGAKVR